MLDFGLFLHRIYLLSFQEVYILLKHFQNVRQPLTSKVFTIRGISCRTHLLIFTPRRTSLTTRGWWARTGLILCVPYTAMGRVVIILSLSGIGWLSSSILRRAITCPLRLTIPILPTRGTGRELIAIVLPGSSHFAAESP